MSSSSSQADAIRRLVRESVAAVDALAPEALRAVLPVLRRVREELQGDLTEWLQRAPAGDVRFSALAKMQALRALESTFEHAKELDPAMARALGIGRTTAGPLAIKNLDTEIRRLSAIFGNGVPVIPDIRSAAVLAKGDKLLWRRHETSARRYAGAVGDDIKQQLAMGVAKHETMDQMVRRLRRLRQLGGAPRRPGPIDPGQDAHLIADGLFQRHKFWADRLVHSELMHSYNSLHDVATEQLNDERAEGEEAYVRRWDASADMRVCSICRGLDGKTAPIGGSFPGGYDSPPAHPMCFLPGTRIGARPVAVMRSNYSGNAHEIELASGRRLRVTPNHPIATERGFIAASLVRRGDKVLSQTGDVWAAPPFAVPQINEQHKPPTVDEVYSALAVRAPSTCTAATDEDLHGDAAGGNGYVDVVLVDRELHDRLNSGTQQRPGEFAFPPSHACHVTHSGSGGSDLPFQRHDCAAHGIVSAAGLVESLFGGHLGPLERLRFGLPAQGDAAFGEPSTENASIDPDIIRKLLHGLTGEVALDEIVEVRNFEFRGHVYNLQTVTGWIVAEGIYTSNCRCVTLAWTERWNNTPGAHQEVRAPDPGLRIGGEARIHASEDGDEVAPMRPIPAGRQRVTEADLEAKEGAVAERLAKDRLARDAVTAVESEIARPRGTMSIWQPGDENRKRQVVVPRRKEKTHEEWHQDDVARGRARQEAARRVHERNVKLRNPEPPRQEPLPEARTSKRHGKWWWPFGR